MDKTDYRKALHSARAEFDRLIGERVVLDQRIVRLKQIIAGLSGLCNGKEAGMSLSRIVPLAPRFMRLTSAIRQVLAETTTPLRPPELKKYLLERGLNMAQYANQLAVIHNTLARLERQAETTELAAGWVLTEKGRLASKMDALDFVPSETAQRSEDDGKSNNANHEATPNVRRLRHPRRSKVKHSGHDGY